MLAKASESSFDAEGQERQKVRSQSFLKVLHGDGGTTKVSLVDCRAKDSEVAVRHALECPD